MDRTTLIEALNTITPGEYGRELFDALARLTVTVAIETVALRQIDSTLMVFLAERPAGAAYDGALNLPGSAMRPGESEADVIQRLAEREYGAKITDSRFVDNFNHPGEERGHFFNPIYLVELSGETTGEGDWYRIDNLPERLVKHHREPVIPMAVQAYLRGPNA